MKLDPNTGKYIITKVITEHKHATSAGEFKHYSTNRRLADEERENIRTLTDLQVETKTIKNFIREKSGKVIQSKDIPKIRQTHQKEKEGGRTKGQIVSGALSGLVVNKEATTFIDTDDTNDVKLIYIQTGEMKEHFRKYPDILFMDTTYSINMESYPLFTIMAEYGDGKGKPVAYCFLKNESKENIEKTLTYFCDKNDVPYVRIVINERTERYQIKNSTCIDSAMQVSCFEVFEKEGKRTRCQTRRERISRSNFTEIVNSKDDKEYSKAYNDP